MIWSLNIQTALNGIGGVKCGLIYFSDKHFTVPVTLTREKTPHLVRQINRYIDQNKQAGYTYSVQYISILENL